MREQQDITSEGFSECVDAGRILLHASFYVWQQARHFPLAAWLEAEEILRRARNEVEDEDRIAFIRHIEQRHTEDLEVGVLQ